MNPHLHTYVLYVLSSETLTILEGIICCHLSTQEGNAYVYSLKNIKDKQ